MNMLNAKSAAIPDKYYQTNLTTTQQSELFSMSEIGTKRNSQEPTAVNRSGDITSNVRMNAYPDHNCLKLTISLHFLVKTIKSARAKPFVQTNISSKTQSLWI